MVVGVPYRQSKVILTVCEFKKGLYIHICSCVDFGESRKQVCDDFVAEKVRD